jgi:hypothetical protein
MSPENVMVVQRIIQAFMQRDWPTALDCYDDAVELDQTRMPGGGVYHGHDRMNAFYARWLGSWDEFEAKLVELIDAGDDVIAILDISGVGKTSGAAVTCARRTSTRSPVARSYGTWAIRMPRRLSKRWGCGSSCVSLRGQAAGR